MTPSLPNRASVPWAAGPLREWLVESGLRKAWRRRYFGLSVPFPKGAGRFEKTGRATARHGRSPEGPRTGPHRSGAELSAAKSSDQEVRVSEVVCGMRW